MRQAEQIVFEKIAHAFDGVSSTFNEFEFSRWQDIPDSWITKSDAFLFSGHDDERFLLPAFLGYLLRHIDTVENESTWLNIEMTLRAFSKEKKADSFKMKLTNNQFSAITAFIQHVAHNVAPDFDKADWLKTLESWQR